MAVYTSVMVLVLPVVVIVGWYGMISSCHRLIWWFEFLLHLSTCSDITDAMTHKYNTQAKTEAVVRN